MKKTNNETNNINKTVTDSTKKAPRKPTSSATDRVRQSSAKEVLAKATREAENFVPSATEILYLAGATDAERKAETDRLQPVMDTMGGSGNSDGFEVTNTINGRIITLVATTVKVPAFLLARDLGYASDPRMFHATEKQKGLTKDFNLKIMDPLLVSYRDGIYWVVDGGRRLLAALDNGITDIPVNIIQGYTREQEADLYANQNKYRILVTPFQKYAARLVAMRKTEILIQMICDQYGITVCQSAKDVDRPLRAIGTAVEIVSSTYGKDPGKYVFCWMLALMKSVEWLNDRTYVMNALTSWFMRSLSQVYAEAEKIGKVPAFTKNLQKSLIKLSPQLIYNYGRVNYPLMTKEGSTLTVLSAIASGALKASDILKVKP